MESGDNKVATAHSVSHLRDVFSKRFTVKEKEEVGTEESISKALATTGKVDSSREIKMDDLSIVLITNDDGIGAPGLLALVAALVDGGRCAVHVCAPDTDKSGVGHSITPRETLAVSSVEIRGAKAYETSGTPADCVGLGLSGVLFPWKKPTLVISGINKGSNCGYHIVYSGTVAGAREAFMCGVPSIALSLNWVPGVSNESDFNDAAEVSLPLIYSALRDIRKGTFPKGCFLNVDIPTHPAQHKGLKFTKQGKFCFGSRWQPVVNQRRLNMGNTGIGIQLAQLGLAASAAGAARRSNSMKRNTVIESTGAASSDGNTPSSGSHKLYFKLEVAEPECTDKEEESEDVDFQAVQEGFIAVTALGALSNVEPGTRALASTWVSSFGELSVSSAL